MDPHWYIYNSEKLEIIQMPKHNDLFKNVYIAI